MINFGARITSFLIKVSLNFVLTDNLQNEEISRTFDKFYNEFVCFIIPLRQDLSFHQA